MSRYWLLAAPILVIGLSAGAVAGRTWQVSADGAGDAPTLQAAIDSAAAGDTVLVACGTYFEHDIEMRPGIALSSQTGLPGCAVIDAQGRGRCFHCVGLDSTASIEGFTLTGGLADEPGEGCNGGAMYCSRSSLHVSHCTFLDNRAACYGGGVFCHESSPVLEACAFHGNVDGHGSRGFHCDRKSSPRLDGCEFGEGTATPEEKRCGDSGKHEKHHGH